MHRSMDVWQQQQQKEVRPSYAEATEGQAAKNIIFRITVSSYFRIYAVYKLRSKGLMHEINI